jgi:BASS family bile acid:Na+ symporter
LNEILSHALNVVIIVFLVSTMLGCGLSLTPGQIFGPLRNVRLTVLSAVSSYLIVPLIAVVVSRSLAIEEPLRFGLVLFSMTAGGEAGPKIVGIAKGDVGFSVGILAGQLGVTIVYVPLIISLLLPDVKLDHAKLLLKLFATVALPICIGLWVNARYGSFASRLSPFMHKTSSFFMLVMVVLLLLLNYEGMLGLFGSRAILTALIFIAGSFMTGYLLGGPQPGTRRALGVMSAARNSSISLMIASQVFTDPKVLMMIVVTVILMLLMLLPTAYWFSRREA